MLINSLEVQPLIKNERNYPHSYKREYYCSSDLSAGI